MMSKNKAIILYGILNWGLGHASRSVSLIQKLQNDGYDVIVCCEGKLVNFLQGELTDVVYEYLPALEIRYKHASMSKNIWTHSLHLISHYRQTRTILKKWIHKYQPSSIYSDNHYAFFDKKIPSYFVGHQWNILHKNGEIHKWASRLNQALIRQFDKLLIPDHPTKRLSGKMTENITMKHEFIGYLSRFFTPNFMEEHRLKKFDELFLLSGPEPTRSLWEEELIHRSLSNPSKKYIMVRGTEKEPSITIPSHVVVYHLVNKNQLKQIILESKAITCRSGYSTVLDLLVLRQKEINFIATPGQPEQEYIASRIEEKGFNFFLPDDSHQGNKALSH